MNEFQYYNPVKIIFGENTLSTLTTYLNDRKALLITSKGFVSRGIVQKVIKENPNIIGVIDAITPNPTIQFLEGMYKDINHNDFEVIIALGGGSVIDSAKALSIFSEDSSFEDIKQLLYGNSSVKNHLLYKPIIAIPTTAGTSSEITPWGTIWDEENKKKYSIYTERLWCELAIYDPLLTLTLPKELTIQTGLDALSHSFEVIWNKNTNPISIKYAIEASKTIIGVLPILINDLGNKTLRKEMMLATLRAGLAFSNTQTSIAHAMSYYMTLYKDIPHGIAASITLPDIVEIALGNNHCKSVITSILGEKPIEVIKSFFDSLNVSLNYEDYQLKVSDFNKIKDLLLMTPRAKNFTLNVDELFEKLTN